MTPDMAPEDRRRSPEDRPLLTPRQLQLALALALAWFALKDRIAVGSQLEGQQAATTAQLLAAVQDLKSAVSDLAKQVSADRTANAAELADLKTRADQGQRDRDQLRARLDRVEAEVHRR